jgi:tape measure domain-containing protein
VPKQFKYTDLLDPKLRADMVREISGMRKDLEPEIQALIELVKKLRTESGKGTTSQSNKEQSEINRVLNLYKKKQKTLQDINDIEKSLTTKTVQLTDSERQLLGIEKQLNNELFKHTTEYRKLNAQLLVAKDRNKQLNVEQQKSLGLYKQTNGFLRNIVQSFKGFIGASIGIYAVVNALKNIFEISKKLDTLRFTLKSIITDSNELAITQSYLIDLSKRYGQDLIQLTDNFTRFKAAIKSSNIAIGEGNRIFESFTKVGAVLGKSSADMDLIFLAVEQMISKGCHAKGYKLMMFDKSLKKIEDIKVGDLLMGEDYTSREVIGLQSGKDNMYEVSALNIDSFMVNENHILPVINSITKKQENVRIKNILENYDNYLLINKLKGLLSFTIQSKGSGEYWGIELTGNNLYLDYQYIYQHNTVASEELRRQLGERIPGAVAIMAKATGVTVKELGKMLKAGEVLTEDVLPKFAKEMERTFGVTNLKNVDNLTAAQNRLKTSWIQLVDAIGDKNMFKVLLNSMSEALSGMKLFIELFTKSDFERALRDEFSAGQKAAKEFADSINLTSKQKIKSYKDEIKVLEIRNLMLGTEQGRKQFGLSIDEAQSEIKTNKDRIRNREYAILDIPNPKDEKELTPEEKVEAYEKKLSWAMEKKILADERLFNSQAEESILASKNRMNSLIQLKINKNQ